MQLLTKYESNYNKIYLLKSVMIQVTMVTILTAHGGGGGNHASW